VNSLNNIEKITVTIPMLCVPCVSAVNEVMQCALFSPPSFARLRASKDARNARVRKAHCLKSERIVLSILQPITLQIPLRLFDCRIAKIVRNNILCFVYSGECPFHFITIKFLFIVGKPDSGYAVPNEIGDRS